MLNEKSNITTLKYINDGNKSTYNNVPWGQHQGGGVTPPHVNLKDELPY